MEQLLSEMEMARKLGVSVRTLQRWRVEGRGPKFVKIGKLVRYQEGAAATYVESCTRQSTSENGGEAA